ncbi:unnamed protein product [Cuscuta epithymum]|uniref:Reverse transcriptase domain-containing protein n=1 Tax=Cuscuta epithymum TaxID=186058 RepID=A0AAV0DTM0_9ASTE|nr:unnamed protein product [Cuscuta epithymum]
MSIVSWNCRGLGNLATVQVLSDLVREQKPIVIFLLETKAGYRRVNEVFCGLGFRKGQVIESAGRSGGLALYWRDEVSINILDSNQFYIDCSIRIHEGDDYWRLTGFYGIPDRGRRKESWEMLKDLAHRSDLPWMVIGDFNDIMFASEKRGGLPQPLWQMRGFREAIWASGLRDFPFDGYQWTWERGRGSSNLVEEKLDRILVNEEWHLRFGNARAFSLEGVTSDHLMLIVKPIEVHQERFKRPFKFENVWVREEECREIIKRSWDLNLGGAIWQKIGRCSEDLGRWGSTRCLGFSSRINTCRRRLKELRGRRGLCYDVEFQRVKNTLVGLLEQQIIFWKQRAKEFWLRDGDTNTRFFHNAVRHRRRINKIRGLRDLQGAWITDRESMKQMVQGYFDILFSTSLSTNPMVDMSGAARVSEAQNRALLRPITVEEVRKATFGMHPDKSPGPDGMNSGFFQNYWNIVGNDVVDFCVNCFEHGQIPLAVNQTNLVLVPKKTKPESMGDWRPIALCNVVYKIFSKVLANRMKGILNDIICENQSAFAPGRNIIDNVVIAFETHHYLKCKRQGKEGFVALKLDMSKAYDRVEWSFLRTVMVELGFDLRWVDLILECVSTVSYSIPFDSSVIGPIMPQRGLRQGDPLSPYLFILVTEGLSALIRKQEAEGRFCGVAVAKKAPKVSHLLFADDSYLFFRANREECQVVKDILKTYEILSGQIINFDKSSVSFSSNVVAEMRDELCLLLGVNQEVVRSKYLGLPALVGRKKREILLYLKERVLKRLQSWNNRFLSKAGREVLLKTVIQAMPTYAMNVFLFPDNLIMEIERLMNGYWWRGNDLTGRGIRWRNWRALCLPKTCGGLGFKRLKEYNIAMLGKLGWKLLTEPKALISRVLAAKYYPKNSFVEAKLGYNPSFVWRSILAAQEVVVAGSRRRVGNGKEISVWRDAWLPGKGTGKILSARPRGILDMNVASLLLEDEKNWNVQRINSIFSEEEARAIQSIHLSINQVDDGYRWNDEAKGNFSVRSCYRRLVGEFQATKWIGWTVAWKFRIPPKVKLFFWQLANGLLPTGDVMRARQVQVLGVCPVCKLENETATHLFLECAAVRETWQKASLADSLRELSFEEWLQFVFNKLGVEDLSRLIMLMWSV